ncbi:MAG: HupE/UreJ family protein [Pseudomonadota bacterium]
MLSFFHRLAYVGGALILMANAAAHPFGGVGANRQAALRVSAHEIEVRYLLDLAEVPAMLAIQEADADHDGQVSGREWTQFGQRWARQVAAQLHLSVAGAELALRPIDQQCTVQADVFGMSATLRIEARFSAPLQSAAGAALLRYRDDFRPEWKGWREVMLAAGPGAVIRRSTVADHDRSKGLTDVYRPDSKLLPDETSAYAELVFAAAPPPAAPQPDVPAGEAGSAPGRGPVSAAAASAALAVMPAERAPTLAPAFPGPAAINQAAAYPSAVTRPLTAASPLVSNPPIVPAPLNTASPPVPNPLTAPPPDSTWRRMSGFFLLGVSHIAAGWDHLLFLFGLLLLSSSLAHTVKVASAFTVAHSITLLLAASGAASLPPVLVEPAIGLTIAYVGLARLLSRRHGHGHGVLLAFGFGLVHGFGFAGALAESLSGAALPAVGWLASIASFNLGIEAFQVLVICLVAPALSWCARRPWGSGAQRGCAAAVLCAGLGIFAARLVA